MNNQQVRFEFQQYTKMHISCAINFLGQFTRVPARFGVRDRELKKYHFALQIRIVILQQNCITTKHCIDGQKKSNWHVGIMVRRKR